VKNSKILWLAALKNLYETCESCALAKSCQKDTNKEKKAWSKTPGKWLFINISHVKSQSFGGSQYWLLAVNDVMDFSFSLFLKTTCGGVAQWLEQFASAEWSEVRNLIKSHTKFSYGKNQGVEP